MERLLDRDSHGEEEKERSSEAVKMQLWRHRPVSQESLHYTAQRYYTKKNIQNAANQNPNGSK